jgi:5-methyltetrahydrofolate--homocysteine methyltransferase
MVLSLIIIERLGLTAGSVYGGHNHMSRTQDFLATLQRGQVLVADGATGTMLQANGLDNGLPPEAWVLKQPDQIRALHRQYIEAGANLILTCTFGGNRYRLESEGLADRVVEVNRKAAQLAREAAGDAAFVAGDMGPTGQFLAPLGTMTAEEAAQAYTEQALGLAEGGVDLLLIETLSDLGEAKAAVQGVRRVTGLPIVTTFSFDTHGRTMMGLGPTQVAAEMAPLVEGLGANCGRDPDEFQEILAAMRQAAPDALLWAKPNAGLPRVDEDVVVYDASPHFMGRIAPLLRAAGAQVVGGCCGTTPEHISAMAVALNGTS